MATDAGSIEAEVRLRIDQLAADAEKAQAEIETLTKKLKKSGEDAGKMYVKGYDKGIQNINNSMNKFVEKLSSISPKLGTIGNNISEGLGGAIPKSMNKAGLATTLFKNTALASIPAIIAASGGLIVVLQAIVQVIQMAVEVFGFFAKAAKKAADEQKQFSANLELSRKAMGALKGETESLTKTQQLQERQAEASNRITAGMAVIAKNIGDAFTNFFAPAVELVSEGLAKVKEAFVWLVEHIPGLNKAILDEAVNAQKLVEENNALVEENERYNDELKKIRYTNKALAKDAKALAADTLEANKKHLDQLIQLRMETAARVGESANEVKTYDQAIDALAKQIKYQEELLESEKEIVKTTKEETDEEKNQKQLQANINAAKKAYEDAIRAAHDAQKAGIVDVKGEQQLLNNAEETYYNTLEKIATTYEITTGELIKQRDVMGNLVRLDVEAARQAEEAARLAKEAEEALNKQIAAEESIKVTLIEQADTLAQQEITKAKENGLINKAIELENELIERQRQRERTVLEGQLELAKQARKSEMKCLKTLTRLRRV